MFELANRLIGIYKTANATQSTFASRASYLRYHFDDKLLMFPLSLTTGISIDNHALTAIPMPNAVAA